MQDLNSDIPRFISNPEHIDRLKKEPESEYYFFWDVITASYVYDIQPPMIAYILTLIPGVSEKSKQLAASFSGYYQHILDRYQNMIEVFVPIFFRENNKNDFHVWGTKVVWEMKNYPETVTPWLNSVGSRMTEHIDEVIADKTTYAPTRLV